jgi:hypothetical protein
VRFVSHAVDRAGIALILTDREYAGMTTNELRARPGQQNLTLALGAT